MEVPIGHRPWFVDHGREAGDVFGRAVYPVARSPVLRYVSRLPLTPWQRERGAPIDPSKADAVGITEIELRHVAVKVLLGAVLIDALHAALEDREEAFNRVRVDVRCLIARRTRPRCGGRCRGGELPAKSC